MHVVMYSIQSSFCTECPLPSSSDTALICAGDFVQPLASLLCLGGVEVSGPERAWKTKSRLCWQSVRMGDAHRFVEAVQERAARRLASFLTVCGDVHAQSCFSHGKLMKSWSSIHVLRLLWRSGCARAMPLTLVRKCWISALLQRASLPIIEVKLPGNYDWIGTSVYLPFVLFICSKATAAHLQMCVLYLFEWVLISERCRGRFTLGLVCSECGVEPWERLNMTIREESN